MAKCDEGYPCQVCSEDVGSIVDSALYLQYVIGWIDPETLHTQRECHVRCMPTLAQFIDDERFVPAVFVEGDFDRRQLDTEFVRERAQLVTEGFQRLLELQAARGEIAVVEYPLPHVRNKWQ
ncbi:MAG: hypothetical protein KDB22_02470 [Planctomycetales bacterium]|nr:hypothetical protein [Planctomycetales bacterium]